MTSGAHALIDAMVAGLELRHEDLQSEAARTYFRGGRVGAGTCTRILRAFHESVIDVVGMLGLIKTSPRPWAANVDRDALVAQAVDAWQWLVHRGGGLDLAILDLALRLYGAAFLCLGDAVSIESVIDALEAPSPRDWIPAAQRPTCEQIATKVRVSPRQVQRWLDGSSMPLERRHGRIANALAMHTPGATVPPDLAVRLSLWFASRALTRALAKRVGPHLAARFTSAIPMLVRTLVQHLEIHPGDVEWLRRPRPEGTGYIDGGADPDGGPFMLLACGHGTMTWGSALDVIAKHAPGPEWRDIAESVVVRERAARAAASTRAQRHKPPPPKWTPWAEPDFLESMRAMPNYGKVAATYASLALRRGRRRAAWQLATKAAARGEAGALAELERTKRRTASK